MGPCVPEDDVEIVDLWNDRATTPGLNFSSPDVIEKFSWASAFTIDYSAARRNSECAEVPGAPVHGRIDLKSLEFLDR